MSWRRPRRSRRSEGAQPAPRKLGTGTNFAALMPAGEAAGKEKFVPVPNFEKIVPVPNFWKLK